MHKTEGTYHDGNLFTNGPPGTRVEKNWLNAVQKELVTVIEGAGLTLKTASTETGVQLLAALNLLMSNRVATDAIWDAAGDLAMGTGANTAAVLTGAMFGLMNRAQFTYSDADQITVGAAQYMCKDKYCYWTSTLTTVATGAAGGADWWYLYLDHSAITSGTEITAAELIWSTTEPAWNDTYRQYMNGDDRCIMAVLTTAGNAITEFLHSGALVAWADDVVEANGVDYDTTWTDVDISSSVPSFATTAAVHFQLNRADGASALSWRTNGQTGNSGKRVGYVADVADFRSFVVTDVITDSAQIFELIHDTSNANTTSARVQGWAFPTGM